jgi:hypothetical protein
MIYANNFNFARLSAMLTILYYFERICALINLKISPGACPERYKILRGVYPERDDTKRRARNDRSEGVEMTFLD